MAGPLSAAAKIAIEELILKRTSESKYGYFLTVEDYQEVVEDLLRFFETSRTLQASGQRIFAGESQEPKSRGRVPRRGNVSSNV